MTAKTSQHDTYNTKSTSVNFPWPKDVSGIERIALSANGDLQRVLSAFFAQPIVIALVYSHTSFKQSQGVPYLPLSLPNPSAITSASPELPIIQTRQVHLECAGKVVCVATSKVCITSPLISHLFLEEKYAIGQMFRRLQIIPSFELLEVGMGKVNDGQFQSADKLLADETKQLWRRYKLSIPDFECEILEVFPCREMFVRGNSWLEDKPVKIQPPLGYNDTDIGKAVIQKKRRNFVLAFELIIFLSFVLETWMYVVGKFDVCYRSS